MKKILLLLSASTCLASDPFVGEYVGKSSNFVYAPDIAVQISKNKDTYKVRIISELLKRCDNMALIEDLKPEDGKLIIKDAGGLKINGVITPDTIKLEGKRRGQKATAELKRYNRVSPTLAAKAPKGSQILFDGKNTDSWIDLKTGKEIRWTLKDDSMTIGKATKKGDATDIETKGGYKDFKLHLEFKCPDLSDKRGQGRSNSGLFIGPYEIQILDSFNEEGYWNECGAVYREVPPQVNASLPPEVWQTYDVEFKAPKYEGEKLVSLPTVTLYHNGKRIHKDTEIPGPASSKLKAGFVHPSGKLKIGLQDHGSPVSFRNIWIVEE